MKVKVYDGRQWSMETIDSIGFFFSLSHQRKRQRWRKQGEGERGFLVAAHIRGCHRDCGKREQFLLSRVNEYYTSDRLNSIKNRIQDLYDIS